MKQIHITVQTSRWYSKITDPITITSEDSEFYYAHPKHFIDHNGRKLTDMGKILKTDCKEVEFVPEFFEFLKTEALKFWNNHVLPSIPPEPRTVADIQLLFPESAAGKTIEASDELQFKYGELKEIKAALKEWEEKKELIEEQIKVAMRDAESVKYMDETLFTWKTAKPSKCIDTDTLKKEQPEIVSKYTIEKPGSRRFLVK